MNRLSSPSRPRTLLFAVGLIALATAWLGAGCKSGSGGASERTLTANETGHHDGYYFSYWKDLGSATMTMGEKGRYGVTWDLGQGNFVGGKGWEMGTSTRVVTYRADVWEPVGNCYLTLYGWTTDPLIEYYIVDSWGTWRPPGSTSLGQVTSDGGTYDLYRTQRVQQPSIKGTATFYQYWSVRTEKRATGVDQTITFANHVDAWKKLGFELGTHNYQIMATEGFQSAGRSQITVSEK